MLNKTNALENKLNPLLNQIFTMNENYWDQLYLDKNTSLKALSGVLYTDQFMCFLLIGIVLLIAMVGSITLTLEAKKREETISRQLSRQSTRSIFVVSGNFQFPNRLTKN